MNKSNKQIKQVQLYQKCYQSLQTDTEIKNLTYPDKKDSLIFNFDIKNVRLEFLLAPNGQNVLMKAKIPMETEEECSKFINTWKNQTCLRIIVKKRLKPYSVECKYDIILTGKPDADFVTAGFQMFEDYLHLMKNIILNTNYNWDLLKVDKDKIKKEKAQAPKRMDKKHNLNFDALNPNPEQVQPNSQKEDDTKSIAYQEKKKLFEIYCAKHRLPFNFTKDGIKTAQSQDHAVLDIILSPDIIEYTIAFQNCDIDELLMKDIMKKYSTNCHTDIKYIKAIFKHEVPNAVSLDECLEKMDKDFKGILSDYKTQAEKENIPFPLPAEQKDDILKRVKEERKKRDLERIQQIKKQNKNPKKAQTPSMDLNLKKAADSDQTASNKTPTTASNTNKHADITCSTQVVQNGKSAETSNATSTHTPKKVQEPQDITAASSNSKTPAGRKEKIVVVPNADIQAVWNEWEEVYKTRKEQLAYRESKIHERETELEALEAAVAAQKQDLNERDKTLKENENIILEWDESLRKDQEEYNKKNSIYLRQKSKTEKLEKDLATKESILMSLENALQEKEAEQDIKIES